MECNPGKDCSEYEFLSDKHVQDVFGAPIANMLATITSCMYCGIVVASADASTAKAPIIVWNKRATEILGVGATPTNETEWSSTYGIFDPETKESFPGGKLPLARGLKGEHVKDQVLLVQNQNKKETYINCSAAPLLNANNEIVGAVVIFLDITESKLQAKEVLRLRQQVASLENLKESLDKIYQHLN